MESIIKPNSTIVGILGKARMKDTVHRLIKYCVVQPLDEGFLLFNTLTRELLLLNQEEYENALESDFLRQHWMTLPADMDEGELNELVLWVQSSMRKESKEKSGYTILTTTNCNARCFYCYAEGCAKINMSPETAEKTADYIIQNSGGKAVTISWFGGEPLLNWPVIDIILQKLSEAGIEYHSRMTSNGYLFGSELTAKAAGLWKCRSVQITLDGSEEVYNRSKAYVNSSGSPFERVLSNIEGLLAAGIHVVVRMNLGLHNSEDLAGLSRSLAARFGGYREFCAYVALIFDSSISYDEYHSSEECDTLYTSLLELEALLRKLGIAVNAQRRLRRSISYSFCMADSGNAEIILPGGQIGLCEHHTDDEFIGHIDSPQRDREVILSWRERFEPYPDCADCPLVPECRELKKCTGGMGCFRQRKEYMICKTRESMLNEYCIWKKGENPVQEETEENELYC